MTSLITQYPKYFDNKYKVAELDGFSNWKNDLSIDAGNGFQFSYAPFDFVNPSAKVVFVGITPGEQQALNALYSMKQSIDSGLTDIDILIKAKHFASFSGPMRSNLVKMLDHICLPEIIDVISTEELFSEDSDIAHFTSVIRYPLFFNEKNYSGSPSPLRNQQIMGYVEQYFIEEIKQLPDALYIPLGDIPTKVLQYISGQGTLDESLILDGIPHPSGANAERIAYFTCSKEARDCSIKTNTEKIDLAKSELVEKLRLDCFSSSLRIPH